MKYGWMLYMCKCIYVCIYADICTLIYVIRIFFYSYVKSRCWFCLIMSSFGRFHCVFFFTINLSIFQFPPFVSVSDCTLASFVPFSFLSLSIGFYLWLASILLPTQAKMCHARTKVFIKLPLFYRRLQKRKRWEER